MSNRYPFPENHTSNKIFNRNKVKVSYSCMQNIKTIINHHNMNILHQNYENQNECNCRNKKYCFSGGKCLLPDTVYQEKGFNATQLRRQSFLWSCRKVIQR